MLKRKYYILVFFIFLFHFFSCSHEDTINGISSNPSQGQIDYTIKEKETINPVIYTLEKNDSFFISNKKIFIYNPYKDHPNKQFKGQLHCHSNKSDGELAPVAVMQKYIDYGYDFMTITDHNYLTSNPDPTLNIVWMGESYEDTRNSTGFQHMNVFNCTEVIGRKKVTQSTNTPESLINHYVKNGNSILSYNHPEDPTVYASNTTLQNLPDSILFVEIFNGASSTMLGSVENISDLPTKAYFGDMYIVTSTNKRYRNSSIYQNSPLWKETTEKKNPNANLDRGFRIMLDCGKKVFCDAVDDFHRGDNMENRGWMMVFAKQKTKESIWNGLITGSSYASSGVELNDIFFTNGIFGIDIKDGTEATTTFLGKGNAVLSTQKGKTPRYEVTGEEIYIRAMIEINGKKAWSQPVWILRNN